MSRKQKRTVPFEAVEIYNQYIHGEISRRKFLSGVKKFAAVGLSATAIVEALMPNYALGQQIRRDDERLTTSYETIPSPDGHGFIKGYLVRPFSADSRSETSSQLPGIIVVHENLDFVTDGQLIRACRNGSESRRRRLRQAEGSGWRG